MYHIFLTHSSTDGSLGCSHILSVANSASGSAGVFVSFWIMVFSEYMLSSGITGSYSSSILVSLFLRSVPIDQASSLGLSLTLITS